MLFRKALPPGAEPQDVEEGRMPFLAHLGELRLRIMVSLIALAHRLHRDLQLLRADHHLAGPADRADQARVPRADRALLGQHEGRPDRGRVPGPARAPLPGLGLHRARAAPARAKVRAAVRHPVHPHVLRRRQLRAQGHRPVRGEVPRQLQDRESRADALGEPLRRLHPQVHAGLRARLRAAARADARHAARAGDARVPLEEPEVRDPALLRDGGHPDADARRLQPAPDGRPAHPALRGRHRGRPAVRRRRKRAAA